MGPLHGLRILDLAGPPGWYCTKLLADLGADVIRVEPSGGDPARRRGPFWKGIPDPERSLAYWYFNTSKRSIEIDLATDSGGDHFRALAGEADAVVETTQPGALDSLGIGYPELSRENPALVWTAITPFGRTGPYSGWEGNDLIAQATGGLMFLAGLPSRPPTQLGGQQAEYQAGVVAACGTLFALLESRRSGIGQLVDISAQAAIALDGENAAPFWDVNGQVRKRLGDRNYRGAIQIFKAKDGWVLFSVGGRWVELRHWLDRLSLLTEDLKDAKWDSSAYRNANPEGLEAVARNVAAAQTRAEIYRDGQEARVSVAPIIDVGEIFDDPQLATRGFWQSVTHPEIESTVTYPGAPYRLSHSPWEISRRPPLPGEHNGEGWLPREEPIAKAPPAPLRPKSAGPLSGVRIVDLTWVAAGPLTTRQLANFGAEVLKVESSVHPDTQRSLVSPRPPGNDSLNVSGAFNSHNQGKKSISLDLRSPDALRILERLISVADVLVDNYGVDPFPKWGLTRERLRELNPELIIARASVMGRTGPRQNFIGFGFTIAAATGHNSVMGFPGDPPVGAGIAHPDYTCNPHHFALAILAALRHRDRTGEGQTIDMSQHESTATWLGPEIMDFAVNGVVARPSANRSPWAAPHGAYPANGDDRWVAIACETDGQFAALCRTIARGDLLDDPRFASLEARKANEDALDAEIAAWTAGLDPWEAAALLQSAGVPAGAIQSHADLIERDPQILHRGHFRAIEHPEAGLRRVESAAIVLTKTPTAMPRHAPLLGEHNDRILTDLLGLSEEELARGYVDGWIA